MSAEEPHFADFKGNNSFCDTGYMYIFNEKIFSAIQKCMEHIIQSR